MQCVQNRLPLLQKSETTREKPLGRLSDGLPPWVWAWDARTRRPGRRRLARANSRGAPAVPQRGIPPPEKNNLARLKKSDGTVKKIVWCRVQNHKSHAKNRMRYI